MKRIKFQFVCISCALICVSLFTCVFIAEYLCLKVAGSTLILSCDGETMLVFALAFLFSTVVIGNLWSYLRDELWLAKAEAEQAAAFCEQDAVGMCYHDCKDCPLHKNTEFAK